MRHFIFSQEDGDEAPWLACHDGGERAWSLLIRGRIKDRSGMWAKVFMDSKGALAIISDYGNFAYHWSDWGDRDFREFLLGLDDGYLGRKLAMDSRSQGQPNRLDVEATLKLVREHICGKRRRLAWNGDKARHEWDLMEDYLKEENVELWMHETEIEFAYELLVYERIPANVRAFLHRLWPLVKEAIRFELHPEEKSRKKATAWAAKVADINTGFYVKLNVAGHTAFEARDDALRGARQRGIQGSIDTVELEPLEPTPFGEAER